MTAGQASASTQICMEASSYPSITARDEAEASPLRRMLPALNRRRRLFTTAETLTLGRHRTASAFDPARLTIPTQPLGLRLQRQDDLQLLPSDTDLPQAAEDLFGHAGRQV